MPQKPDYLVKITNKDDAKFFKEHLNELKKLQVQIEDSEKKRQKREDGSRRRYFPKEKELQDARFKEVEADLKHVKTEYAKNYIPKIEQKKEEVGEKDENIGAEVVGDILSLGDKNGKKIEIKAHQRKAKSIFRYGLDYITTILLNPFRIDELGTVKFLSCT